MPLNINIKEGNYLPKQALAFGLIIPYRLDKLIPVRRYGIIRFPIFHHEAKHLMEFDAIVARWEQLCLVYTDNGKNWEPKKSDYDGFRFLWLPTEDLPTTVITDTERVHNG
jgi:hypothetical protein